MAIDQVGTGTHAHYTNSKNETPNRAKSNNRFCLNSGIYDVNCQSTVKKVQEASPSCGGGSGGTGG